MNLAKCSEKDYIKFLVASFKMCTCTEAARSMPESGQEIAHDAITRLNPNRHVNPDGTSNRPISEVEIPPEGRIVHLKGYEPVKVFRVPSADGDDVDFWATDVLTMNQEEQIAMKTISWKIEEFHQGVKQYCGIEKCQARNILFSIRSFLVLERN